MLTLLLAVTLSQPIGGAKPFVVFGAAAVADMATTEMVLYRGGREVNPLMRDRGIRLATNAAIVFATAKATHKLRKSGHRNAARVVTVAFVGLRVVSVVLNVRALSRQGLARPGEAGSGPARLGEECR